MTIHNKPRALIYNTHALSVSLKQNGETYPDVCLLPLGFAFSTGMHIYTPRIKIRSHTSAIYSFRATFQSSNEEKMANSTIRWQVDSDSSI